MKNKSFLVFVASGIIFSCMILLLEFDYTNFIDIYSKNIQNFFSADIFKSLFLFITNIMSIFGILAIMVLSIYLLRKSNAKKAINLYIISIFACLIITNIIKIIIRRNRPVDKLLEIGGFSFPSSHASVSMLVYGYIILLIRKYYHGKWKNLYIFLFVTLILLTGISRIYFNVHYITDVLAGYSIGLIILCFSNYYLKKI